MFFAQKVAISTSPEYNLVLIYTCKYLQYALYNSRSTTGAFLLVHNIMNAREGCTIQVGMWYMSICRAPSTIRDNQLDERLWYDKYLISLFEKWIYLKVNDFHRRRIVDCNRFKSNTIKHDRRDFHVYNRFSIISVTSHL